MTAPRTLRIGASGPDVFDLQHDLQALGHYDGDVDGRFGGRTETAVMLLQRAAGLERDGVVGRATREALSLALGARPLDTPPRGCPPCGEPPAPSPFPGVRGGRRPRPRKRVIAGVVALAVAAWPALEWAAEPTVVIVDAVIEAFASRPAAAPAFERVAPACDAALAVPCGLQSGGRP